MENFHSVCSYQETKAVRKNSFDRNYEKTLELGHWEASWGHFIIAISHFFKMEIKFLVQRERSLGTYDDNSVNLM